MNNPDIEKFNKTTDSMAQYEFLLSDIYENCAARWTKDKEFWFDTSHQEIHHSENTRTMQEIITKKPSNFEADRPFNPIAVNMVIAGLKDITPKSTSCVGVATTLFSLETNNIEGLGRQALETAQEISNHRGNPE
jgi:hypothetical protein